MIVELIDRQAVIDMVCELIKVVQSQDVKQVKKDLSLIPLNSVKTFVETIPTIDAEPIRHGKWKIGELEIVGDDIYGGEFELQHEICSVCGHDNMAWRSNYCPNCGAKMDEVME